MTTIDRIRKLAAMWLVIAAGAHLNVGVGGRLALAQTTIPKGLVQFGPNHETEMPGGGVTTTPVFSGFGISPVLPGHPRFLPYSNDPRQFGAVLAADSGAYAVSGGFGYSGYGGLGIGGYGYPSMGTGAMGIPGMYGTLGGPGSGLGVSLPPTPEFGGGAYHAGNPLPASNVGMGLGAGNPADPAAPAGGNAGATSIGVTSEDAFDNAANGHPSPTRRVRSNQGKAARRPTARKATPQPSGKVESRVRQAVPRRLEVPGGRPQQPNTPQEKPSTLTSEESRPAPRRSLLGSPR